MKKIVLFILSTLLLISCSNSTDSTTSKDDVFFGYNDFKINIYEDSNGVGKKDDFVKVNPKVDSIIEYYQFLEESYYVLGFEILKPIEGLNINESSLSFIQYGDVVLQRIIFEDYKEDKLDQESFFRIIPLKENTYAHIITVFEYQNEYRDSIKIQYV